MQKLLRPVPQLRSWPILALVVGAVGCSAPASRGAGHGFGPGTKGALIDPHPVQSDDETDASELAKATQNPLANMISLPFQNNTGFDWGPGGDTRNVLDIQPIVPIDINEDWLMITRTILPVVSQSVPGASNEVGLADTTVTAWFSPRHTEGWTWGVGPVALLPTSTDESLGTGEWGGGASFIGLVMSGPWVVGGLVNNVWSFESDDVNTMLLQPFVNYNLQHGWYLVSAPTLTANWNANSDERWTVPIGGGAGRVMKFGSQPVNLALHYYYNIEHPTFGAAWTLRLQIQFLFPKK